MLRSFLVGAALSIAAPACFFELSAVREGTGGAGAGGGGSTGGDGGAGAMAGTGVVATSGTSTGTAGGDGGTFEITVRYPSGVTSELVTGVPVPIVLTPGRIDYDVTAQDGADLRAFDEEGTPLPLEIDVWRDEGTTVLWTRLPQLRPEGGRFSLRFGDTEATPGPNAADVWQDYAAVYHLSDADQSTVKDSARAAMGTASAIAATSSPLGVGAAFDGQTSVINLGDVAAWSVPPGEARTITAWFRRQVLPDEMPRRGMTILSSEDPGPSCRGWSMRVLGDDFANTNGRFTVDGCTPTLFRTSSGGLGTYGDTDWHRFDLVVDRVAGELVLFTDGDRRGGDENPTATTGAAVAASPRVGLGPPGATLRFEGVVDEIRVRTDRPSEPWLEATFALEEDPQTPTELLVYEPAVPIADASR
ncbi:MAG: hypothetical protein AAGN82_18960 [Myxococcota bacterium]